MRRQRPLSFCRNRPARARKQLASGADCQWPPLVLRDTLKPCAIHLQQTAAAHLRFPGDRGLQSEMPALPVLCLHVGTVFWLPASLCMPLSLSGLQRHSCPSRSLIRLQAAGMQELLAIFMDPLICHWKTEKNTQTDKQCLNKLSLYIDF